MLGDVEHRINKSCVATSSLADGLDLRAPELPLGTDGRFAPSALSAGWLSGEATRQRRAARAQHASVGAPFLQLPYSNDALLARCPIAAASWLWSDPNDPGVRFLPASSVRGDVERATQILADVPGPEWQDALMYTIFELSNSDPTISDFVLDLQPGTWGFAHAALVAMLSLASASKGLAEPAAGIEWAINPVFVASADRNALVPTLEYVASQEHHFPTGLAVVANRSNEAPTAVRERARLSLSASLRSLGLEQRLEFLPESRPVSALFRTSSPLDVKVALPTLATVLRLG